MGRKGDVMGRLARKQGENSNQKIKCENKSEGIRCKGKECRLRGRREDKMQSKTPRYSKGDTRGKWRYKKEKTQMNAIKAYKEINWKKVEWHANGQTHETAEGTT